MDPVIVEIGPLAIRWYGVMVALTVVVGMAVAYRIGPRMGVSHEIVDRTVFGFAAVALIGARLGYVVSHPREFGTLVNIIRIDLGGLTSHGAIAAGLLYLAWAGRRYGVSTWSLTDVYGWTIPIGNIFVRLGNFINGELYGDPTALPWGVRFPAAPELPRHPLQIYEMVLAGVILVVAGRVACHRRFEGQVFWTIVAATSAGRLVFDLMRSEVRIAGWLTMGQVPAIVLVAWAAAALWRGRPGTAAGR